MTPADEELLERILTGDLDEGSDEARAALDASPAARAELARLRELETALSRERLERDATLGALVPVPGEDAIVRGFREQAQVQVQRAPARRARWLAAAALVLACAWLGWRALSDDNAPAPGDTLGPEHGALAPVGAVERYDVFRWSLPLPQNGTFELAIYDASGALLRSVTGLREASWTPEAEFERTLPARIEWSALVDDASGAPSGAGTPRSAAWRR